MATEKRAVTVRRNRDIYENIAEYIKIFGHPTAIGIVYALSERTGLKRNVGDITVSVGVSRVSISKMLSRMRLMGIVDFERHGTEKFYYLCEDDKTAEKIINIVAEGS